MLARFDRSQVGLHMASLSIRQQIYVAVGSALTLLAMLATISYLAIVQLAAIFTDYKATAHQTLFANEFLEDVYNAQLAAFSYRLKPSQSEVQAVWDHVVQIATRQLSAEELFEGHSLAIDGLKRIARSTHDYRDAFARMIELNAESDAIVDELLAIGPEIRQRLTTIMDFAYENGDTWVGYDIGVAQQEFMRGRFYHERYLITNDPDAFSATVSFMDNARRNIEALSPRLYDPTMQQLASAAVEEISDFVKAARQNHDILVRRNDVRDRQLDRLGPEIKTELETLLHSVVDRQRALGASGSRGAEATLITVSVLSVSALFLGLFLAAFVGRRISRRVCAMAETMNDLASGNLEIEVGEINQKHEIGMMARALEVFRVNAQALQQSLEKERELNGLQRQFVSMVSHEFRTPLAIIDGNAQRLQRRPGKASPERISKMVTTIRKSVLRLTDLMESVLSAARLEDGKIKFDPAPFDLGDMVADICRNYDELSESHTIVTDLDGLPATFVGDIKLLRQVISNLVSNAVKYSPDSPMVRVVGKEDDEGAVVISVEDEGIGIPSAELDKLSERFFRASTSTGIPGSGIGLHLVRHLVDLHHGAMTVESEVGKGSVFKIRLPARATGPSAEPTAGNLGTDEPDDGADIDVSSRVA